MALNWQWSDKVGEAFFENAFGEEHKVNLYKGNAFLIFINEWKEKDENGEEHNMYSLYSFFADEAHAKNCLGLTKGYDNIFMDGGNSSLKRIRLNKSKFKDTRKLVDMLVKTFDEITIELYREEK